MALESVLSSDDDALPAVCTSSARRRRCRPQHRPGPGRKPRAVSHFHLLQGSKRSPAARSRLPSPSANRPRHGEPPSPIQEAAGSSEASVALVGTPIPIPIPTTPHHSARCARGERRPADPRPHAARSGTAVQPPPRLKTGIGARGCVAYTSSNRNNTIPHGYEPVNIWPPRIPGAGTNPSMRHSFPFSGPATALQRLRLGI